MTFRKLQEISRAHFYSLSIDRYFPKILRNILRKIFALLALISFILSFNALPLSLSKGDSMFFAFLFLYLVLFFIEVFYRSMQGEGLRVRVQETILEDSLELDYSLSSILFITDDIDVTRAIFESKVGKEVLSRSGISKEIAQEFLHSGRTPILANSLNISGESINLPNYLSSIYDADKSFQALLSQNSVNKEEFLGAVEWVMHLSNKVLRNERFWSRENLGTIPSIGTSWSYGTSQELSKFGVDFEKGNNTSVFDIDNHYRDKEISTLENILERKKEANAIIIDDDQNVAREIVGRLIKRIKLGVSLPSLEHKSIIEFDWVSLNASFKENSDLEAELLKLWNQSISAGNVILYINDLSGLISSMKARSLNFSSLITPFLSSGMHIIASVTNVDFHFFIENNPALLEKFERVIPEPFGVKATVSALIEEVPAIESEYGFLVSYGAVLAIANSADRFITYGEMPNKAIELFLEMAPSLTVKKGGIIKEEDVLNFVTQKTGVSLGSMKEGEGEKVTHLEETLHKRVVGQDDAIESIASAIRRSRSGINNPKKPVASFLFIGPTGVGKTEVSKALAETYFGREDKMIRFDMSEYSAPDALSRMIGEFSVGKSGVLASKIRDNSYSVLLLDEFEKASPDILDLFLQILDEGVFTDALGKPVMCRNLLIIATSNAGSGEIWKALESNKNLNDEKQNIIDSLIAQKIFKPELLNRFDSIVLFQPLQNEELKNIATLGLEKLKERLKEKDLELVINNDLINFLVEKGSDPKFGGRSVNRAIQNEIEDLIARKIVSGEATPGSKIEIRREELE